MNVGVMKDYKLRDLLDSHTLANKTLVGGVDRVLLQRKEMKWLKVGGSPSPTNYLWGPKKKWLKVNLTESPDTTNELVTFPILKIRRDPKRSG
jgi:hypothetical protein